MSSRSTDADHAPRSFSQLTPVWAGTNQEFMMARPCEFAGFNSDITPQYDDMQPYYKVDIPEACPHLAATPGRMHALPYPNTSGHKYQTWNPAG